MNRSRSNQKKKVMKSSMKVSQDSKCMKKQRIEQRVEEISFI